MDARREWLPKAIECFQRQTYPETELVIVYTGEHLVPEGLAERDNAKALVIHCKGTIGHKRNVGCEQARGEFVCHWDDDDWSCPGRVANQITTLQSTGKFVTGYHSMKFKDEDAWWQYVGSQGYALGSSLCYRRDWWAAHRFDDSLQVGEDSAFVIAAIQQRKFIAEPDMDFMYATIHSGNTCRRATKRESCWKPLSGFQWRAA